jgi:DNA-binding LacI/PurR family transcriptional regulator
MPATLQTVADAVGVSRSTVSNAYSRPDQLSPELRAKILEAAQRLGYPGPHPAARSLRRGRAGAVGVLLTAALSEAFTDPYAVQFLRGMAESAQRHGSGLLLVPVSHEDTEGATQTVLDAVVDGFCVFCVPDWHAVSRAVRSRGLPVVAAEQRLEADWDGMYVGIDEEAAAYAAVAHLTGLGHRRVALIADMMLEQPRTALVPLARPEQVPYHVSRERLRGYRRALAEVGVDWPEVAVANAEANTRAAGAAAAALVLDRVPRPTAIAAHTDLLALGVLDALEARGLRPGWDISVTGFDDIPDAARARLTTVRQPAREKGRIAGGLLLDPPADRDAGRLVLPTELVVRASTGPVNPETHGRN